MQLYLIRHPLPEIESGICYGQSDIPAQENHLLELLNTLPRRLPEKYCVFSSPLKRCSKLALLLDKNAVLDERLMEMDFGYWEMQQWNDISRIEIDAWAQDVCAYSPGEGENAIKFAARTIAFICSLKQQFSSEDNILIISHAGSMRMLLAYLEGMNPHALAHSVVEQKRDILFDEIYPLHIA